MKLKIIFGIALPIIFIIVLAILGSNDSGFSVKKKFVDSISLKDAAYNGQPRNTIKIGDIILENEYFLGKRYSLPALTACLIDKEKVKQNANAGSVFYSEGDYDPYSSEGLVAYNDYQQRSIEIPAYGKETAGVFMNPSYAYYANYSELLAQYQDYDELIILEKNDKSRNRNGYYDPGYQDCYNLKESDIEEAKHIPLILR